MPPPGLNRTVQTLLDHLEDDHQVRPVGAHAKAAAAALDGRVDDHATGAACAPWLMSGGPLVPTLQALAGDLDPGAIVAVSDLVWRTAPSPALLAAFPGTIPMEGYEMQVRHAGFDVVERVDHPPADLVDADLSTSQREAVAGDERGAALWWTLIMRKVEA